MSYNLIEYDKDSFRCQETMGLVEFLRRVKRKEPLPKSLRVQGLDTVLEEAQDTTETAKVIRKLVPTPATPIPTTTLWTTAGSISTGWTR